MVKTEFENMFPSFKEIEFICKPCNEQFYSARNNHENVIPVVAVKNYLIKHCLDKQKVKDVLDWIAEEIMDIDVSSQGCNYGMDIVDKAKKKLGLSDDN